MEKPTGREVRIASETWPLEDIEIRTDGDGLSFRGYAAVFNSKSEDLGGFRETIRPGAFTKSLGEKRAVKMFLNHNSDIVLGSTRKGSLALSQDERGLLAEATLPDNEWGRPVADAIRRGDIDSMSFGFQTIKDSWSEDLTSRELIEARLFEVSPVTAWPAYPATSASVRELAAVIEAEVDDLAAAFAILRDAEARLTPEQASLLTQLINARSERPVRRAFTEDERAVYAAFEAALT
jgi:uncharacterized protein